MEPSASRESLRSSFLGARKKCREKTIEIDVEGVKRTVLLVEPTVGERERIMRAGKVSTRPGEAGQVGDMLSMTIASVLVIARDPESRLPLFEQANREELVAQPACGWFNNLNRACAEMMHPPEVQTSKSIAERIKELQAELEKLQAAAEEADSPLPPSAASSSP